MILLIAQVRSQAWVDTAPSFDRSYGHAGLSGRLASDNTIRLQHTMSYGGQIGTRNFYSVDSPTVLAHLIPTMFALNMPSDPAKSNVAQHVNTGPMGILDLLHVLIMIHTGVNKFQSTFPQLLRDGLHTLYSHRRSCSFSFISY